eukprot:395986-Alexandrium_andersonii.AAC.1
MIGATQWMPVLPSACGSCELATFHPLLSLGGHVSKGILRTTYGTAHVAPCTSKYSVHARCSGGRVPAPP